VVLLAKREEYTLDEREKSPFFEGGLHTSGLGQGHRPRQNEGIIGRSLQPEEVVAYSRKSNDDSGAAQSIRDQIESSFETAAEWGLPIEQSGVLSEQPGHGGDEWWMGGGAPGLEGYIGPKVQTRPILTELMKGVVAGHIRAVIVWSCDRLWRDVGICEAMIKIFADCGVALYDRNGPVNISTPDGRNSVRAAAVSAQNMREMAAVSAPRGILRCRNRGKLVMGANRLGFRSVGGSSGQVRHIAEEQELARELFRRFDTGWSVDQMARWLTDENYQWLTDVAKPNKPAGTPTTAVHRQTIRNVLRDCRYQGRQPHAKGEWPCAAFLVDGQPVVPVDLFERVQAKLRSRSRGAPSHSKTHALSSLVRCGLCGQSMRSHRTTAHYKTGKTVEWVTWKSLHHNVECWCTHELPVIYVSDLDNYVEKIMRPLLIAELQERAGADGQASLASERAAVARDLTLAERRLNEELPEEWLSGLIDRDMLVNMDRKVRERVASLKARVRELDRKLILNQTAQLATHAQNISDENPAVRRDALRAVIRWIAVIPTDAPRVRDPKSSKWQTQPDAGRVVFLTVWGTYHTAFIERQKTENHRCRLCSLRPATAEEVIGTVADFPDPDAFVAGLARAYKNLRYGHSPEDVAPGYSPGRQQPIAEFCERNNEFDEPNTDCTDEEVRSNANEQNAE
jgi:DNA invertase Pin-like site-specific DNA recombinase/ribosomal protein L32